MSASFKWSIEEGFDDFYGLFYGCKSCWDANYVGVVMGSSEGGEFFCPADGATDVGVFIGGHSDAVSASADEYS